MVKDKGVEQFSKWLILQKFRERKKKKLGISDSGAALHIQYDMKEQPIWLRLCETIRKVPVSVLQKGISMPKSFVFFSLAKYTYMADLLGYLLPSFPQSLTKEGPLMTTSAEKFR